MHPEITISRQCELLGMSRAAYYYESWVWDETALAMGLSEVEMRGDFKSTAYWNPSLVTDANGEAVIKFNLPDNLTTFRIMAVGQTKDSKFGRGEKALKVAKPCAQPRRASASNSRSHGATHSLRSP